MATASTPPDFESPAHSASPAIAEKDAPLSDRGNGGGPRGGGGDGDFDRWRGGPFDPDRPHQMPATPLSVYRFGAFVGVVSISSIFIALTTILRIRWAHSKDWVGLALPHYALYANTLILLASSVTFEFGRFALRRRNLRRSVTFLIATLFLGICFVFGQYNIWQELVARGFYLSSNPGSFFFYVLTALHAVHLLGGIVGLAVVTARLRTLAKKQLATTAIDAAALYWHFMDGLWIYVLALLLLNIQR